MKPTRIPFADGSVYEMDTAKLIEVKLSQLSRLSVALSEADQANQVKAKAEAQQRREASSKGVEKMVEKHAMPLLDDAIRAAFRRGDNIRGLAKKMSRDYDCTTRVAGRHITKIKAELDR